MENSRSLLLITTHNMAFNPTEQEIIKAGVAAGKTRPEVEQALTNYRTGVIPTQKTPEQPGYLSRVGSELGNAFSGLQDTTSRGAELMNEGKPIQGAVMSGLGAAGGFIRGAFSPLTAAVAPTIQKVIKDSGITDNAQVQSVMQGVDKWAKENPDLAKNTQNVIEIATTLIGTKGVTAGFPAVKNTATQVIDKGTDFLSGVTRVGRDGITDATSKALDPANIMQRVARVSKGKQAAFQELTGESVGSYLVNRKIFGDIDQISTKLFERFTSSKGNADKAIAQLKGEYKNPAVGSALSSLLAKEVKTSSPGAVSRDLGRVRELSKKHLGGGLTMKEINEVKRLYERNVKVDYLRENLPDKVKEANNVDSAIRQFQFTRAAQLGLKDLPAINKETQAAKRLLDDIGAEYAGAAGNNAVSLTDWIILAGGSPTAIGGFLAKKTLSSKGFMSKVAETLSSKLPKKELPMGNIGEPTIDNYLKFLKSTEGQTKLPQPLSVSKESPSLDTTTPRPKAQGAATPNTAQADPLTTEARKVTTQSVTADNRSLKAIEMRIQNGGTPTKAESDLIATTGQTIQEFTADAIKKITPKLEARIPPSIKDLSEELRAPTVPLTVNKKVYRGTGGGIRNTTLVNGKYHADSSEFASNFGTVSESRIPIGTQIFNLDPVKNAAAVKQVFINTDDLTNYLMDRGVTWTRNTNSRGVEFVKLERPRGSNPITPENQAMLDQLSLAARNGQQKITNPADFVRAKNLTPELRDIETKVFDKILGNEDTLLADYKAKYGKVVNADNFRPFFKAEGYNGQNSEAVQEAVSYLAKRARTEALKNEGKYVVGTAGGSGVGKTSAGNGIPDIKGLTDSAAMVLDSNFSSLDSAHKFIKEVEASGKEFKGVFTYRDAIDALENGIIKRTLTNPDEMGRIVPNSVSSGNHIDSFAVVRKLVDEGHQFLFVDNSLGSGKAKIVSLADLEAKIKYPSKAELKAQFDAKVKELYENKTPFTDREGKTHTLSKNQYESLIR